MYEVEYSKEVVAGLTNAGKEFAQQQTQLWSPPVGQFGGPEVYVSHHASFHTDRVIHYLLNQVLVEQPNHGGHSPMDESECSDPHVRRTALLNCHAFKDLIW